MTGSPTPEGRHMKERENVYIRLQDGYQMHIENAEVTRTEDDLVVYSENGGVTRINRDFIALYEVWPAVKNLDD
jgi:hypothetical protein